MAKGQGGGLPTGESSPSRFRRGRSRLAAIAGFTSCSGAQPRRGCPGGAARPRPLAADWVSCASAEGLHGAGGAAAAGRGALAGLHHLPLRGLRHHAQQHWRALPRAGLPHLHLPQGGKRGRPDRAPARDAARLSRPKGAITWLRQTEPPALLFTLARFLFIEFT